MRIERLLGDINSVKKLARVTSRTHITRVNAIRTTITSDRNLDRKTRLMSDEMVGEIRRHGPLLPDTIRCIICGPSNCDKTNALISLIKSPHGVRVFEISLLTEVSIFGRTTRIDK